MLLAPPAVAIAGTAWPGRPFKTVRLYLYNLDGMLHGETDAPVKNGALDRSVVLPGAEPGEPSVRELVSLLNSDTRWLEEGLSKCFIPHHALVFFDDADRPIASAAICFYCKAARLWPPKQEAWPVREARPEEIADTERLLLRLRALIGAAGQPVYERVEEYRAYGESLARRKARSTLEVSRDVTPNGERTIVIHDYDSPWRRYLDSYEVEGDGRHVKAVAIEPAFEVPGRLVRYSGDLGPLLAIDRAHKCVVVNDQYFGELERVDATWLPKDAVAVVGRAKPAALRLDPARLLWFLVESQLIMTYQHIEATLDLIDERSDTDMYRATLDGFHVYYTNARYERRIRFEVRIDKTTGMMSVIGR